MRRLTPVLLLSCLLPLAAQAQEPAAADPVILNLESGSVMVSQQGAEFVTVDSDVSLQHEDRVLVPEGSVASLDYGDGCVVRLVTGAYPVAAACPLTAAPVASAAAAPAPAPAAATGAAVAGGTNTGVIIGVVAGVAAVAALAGGGGSSSSPDPTPPVSR